MLVIILVVLVSVVKPYLEIQLFRSPAKPGESKKWDTGQCPKGEEEPCFYKDIVYGMHLYYQGQLYLMAADLTSSLGWIKGRGCYLAGTTNKKCKLIAERLTYKISQQFQNIKQTIFALRRRQTKQGNTGKQLGTLQRVKGSLQTGTGLTLQTYDSNRYRSMLKIIGVGFFIQGEKDRVGLEHTNYIAARILDPSLNSLSDGAVSLRFDTESESSFLNQLFVTINQDDRAVTVFLGKQNFLSIGEIDENRIEGGVEGIQWISLNNQNHLVLDSVLLGTEDMTVRVKSATYLSLSASYLSLPSQIMQRLIKHLSSYKCSKTLNGFVQCSKTSSKLMSMKLTLTVNGFRLQFSLRELVQLEKGSRVTFSIRGSDSDVVILGQILFNKFVTVFDYRRSRVGLGKHFVVPSNSIVSEISMVRFIVFCFSFGCIMLMFTKPIKALVSKIKETLTSSLNSNTNKGRSRDASRQFYEIRQEIEETLQ